MKQCVHCLRTIEDDVYICPFCNAPQPVPQKKGISPIVVVICTVVAVFGYGSYLLRKDENPKQTTTQSQSASKSTTKQSSAKKRKAG